MQESSQSVVAVVDDDPRVLEAIGNLLDSAGYQVLRFDSAESFLAAGQGAAVQCLISDVGMPGMNGLELQSLLGRTRPQLRVILVTARDDATAGAQAPNNHGMLQKPFDGQQLLHAVSAALRPANPR